MQYRRGLNSGMLPVMILCAWMLVSLSCLRPYHKESTPRLSRDELEIRVGLALNQPEIDIEVEEPFAIRDAKGRVVSANTPAGKWRVTIQNGKAARIEYRLLVATVSKQSALREQVASIRNAGFQPEALVQYRPEMPFERSVASRKIYRLLLKDKFDSKEQAEQKRQEISDRITTSVYELEQEPANGRLLLRHVQNQQQYELESGFAISAGRFTLNQTSGGASAVYSGPLEIIVTSENQVTAVNTIGLEEYLSGVVPSEMSPGFPLEALKAQAIAARSEAVRRIMRNTGRAVYDICADIGCQVYTGLSRRSDRTDRAVQETAGVVLMDNNEVVQTPYSGVCGGFTESSEEIWTGPAYPHLRGKFDGRSSSNGIDLSTAEEFVIRKWIEERPDAYCNLDQQGVPPSLGYARKYFRWQIDKSAFELTKSIQRETGRTFGELLDLQPIERGDSGRTTALQVIGTQESFEVTGELAIRRALSAVTLWSSLFVVERLPQTTMNNSRSFRFKGAGWGHGVGMCQVGAAMMAHSGKSYQEILRHYYSGVVLQKVY